MIFWGHPDITPILKRRAIPIYLDATFRTVLKPFSQCLILMTFDDENDIYVPILFALMEDKSAWSYWHFLHFAIVLSKTKLKPTTVTTDFEKRLMTACKEQFPKTHLIGCLFHFKQALRRKLQKLSVDQNDISIAMGPGILDSLTLISREEISGRIIEIKLMFNESDPEKWLAFFSLL